MKNPLLLLMLICFLSYLSPLLSQNKNLRKIDYNTFIRGEHLKYEAYYQSMLTGRLTAGIVTLDIKNENTKFYGRNTLHIEGIGKTKGLFNLFYKVIDRYETWIDEEAIVPWKFIRRVNEGNYKIDQDIYFNHFENKAEVNTRKKNSPLFNKQTVNLTDYSQDIVSAFYFARTFDVSNLVAGKSFFNINFIIDDSVYVTKIIYAGKENISTRLGKFRCLKFKPMVLKGNVFDDPYPMTLYISDDDNRIPILAESEIIIGKVRLELIKFSHLANPVKALIK